MRAVACPLWYVVVCLIVVLPFARLPADYSHACVDRGTVEPQPLKALLRALAGALPTPTSGMYTFNFLG